MGTERDTALRAQQGETVTERARLKCEVVGCTRTGYPDEGDTAVICAGCWKLVPRSTRARYAKMKKRLRKRWLELPRDADGSHPGMALVAVTQRTVNELWARIVAIATEAAVGFR